MSTISAVYAGKLMLQYTSTSKHMNMRMIGEMLFFNGLNKFFIDFYLFIGYIIIFLFFVFVI